MRVLLLGLINSQWTANFVEECLLKNNYEVWMLKCDNNFESRKWISFYKKAGIQFINCIKETANINSGRRKKNYLKVSYGRFMQIRTILRAGHFDIINLHYVNSLDMLYVASLLKHIMKSKLVFSYWGSDLLRSDNKELHSRGKYVRQADFITFDNRDLEIKFEKTYKWAFKIPSKTVLFGLPILDIINKKYESNQQADLRKKWNIPEDKTVIAVGYNGGEAQQHIKILKKIGSLDNKIREKIVLLLQMTYSGTKEYKKKVIAQAKATGCEYVVIQHFLSDDEVAELRIITDVFINAQITDAFSGSVCENLFAGTVLINARWLCYQEFMDYDFKFLEFKNLNEVGQHIKTVMEKKADISGNKELIWQLRSWEYCAPEWKRVFEKLTDI